ncbi:class I SAM-dependent DNA methyltransferase [Motilibacter deserti]|uniref:Class I SAM-dependent methyltransferase n=1 Tax=Motilibacter deserti TaxID=2714956 RepID=A0ABX0GPU2_9ACTN|nr:class I SAM-dependent methyltransferase [Motilibacter deserti]NHC12490.1 class I SAM-dependent methyltransferase [Motilibacter deserti]
MSALAAYEQALLHGVDCVVRGARADKLALPVARWMQAAGPADEDLLQACAVTGGPVLDVGCGPGRLAAELVARGVPTLGLDLSGAAVALARFRGAYAEQLDVFGPVPDTGAWGCILLADGNIGIGGDPTALLARCAQLLRPGGRVVADVSTTVTGVRRAVYRLEASTASGTVGGPLRWAAVGCDAVAQLGEQAGLRLRSVRTVGRSRRAVVVWEKEGSHVD